MTTVRPVPIPLQERIVFLRDRRRYPNPGDFDPQEGKATRSWVEWWTNESTLQSQSPRRIHNVDLEDKAASIVATDMSDGALEAGLYRVSYFATITQAATTSSSLTVTLDFTYRSVSKSFSGSAITANTTGTIQFGGGLIEIDKNSPVRYSTTYASVGATAMQYDLKLTLERLL